MGRRMLALASGPRRRLAGAVMVETLIAFPTLFFAFFGILQVLELYAASLLVQRAAGAAVRAAVVVMPDHPQLYPCGAGMTQQSDAASCKRAEVDRAAALVLQAGHGFRGAPLVVELSGEQSGHNPITARVTATYRCFVPPLGLACGLDGQMALSAQASLPFQGAEYDYVQ